MSFSIKKSGHPASKINTATENPFSRKTTRQVKNQEGSPPEVSLNRRSMERRSGQKKATTDDYRALWATEDLLSPVSWNYYVIRLGVCQVIPRKEGKFKNF